MRAADLNRLLLQGRRRAEELEARLAGVLVPILERAGEEAAQRFRARATDHLTASASPGAESDDPVAREITRVAEEHRPDGGYGDTAWNASTRTVYWVSADWTSNDEMQAAEDAFLAIDGVDSVEHDAESCVPEGSDWAPMFCTSACGGCANASLTAAGDPPQWSAPAPDELIDVPSLVVRLRAKTKPVRDAVAETMMTPALNRVGIDFDVKNPLVGEVLSQSASQVTHIAETTQLNVMRIIKESYEAGLSIPNTATAIQEGMHAAAEERAALIARTELAGVVNGGALAVTKLVSSATGDSFTKKWLTGAGARNPRHELYDDLDGQEQPLSGYFDVGGVQLQHPGDPAGPPEEICNCFPAGTLVVARDVEVGFRRRYDGYLVRIETDAQNELAGTPNHPVLTSAGWKPLGELREGDHLVCGALREDEAGVDPDVENAPTAIEDVVGPLTGGRSARRIRGCAVDFHGDGSDGEIDVVAADRVLRDRTDAAVEEPEHELALAGGYFGERLGFTGGASLGLDVAHRLRATASVREGREAGALRGGGLGHAGEHRGGTVTAINSEFREAKADDVAADAVALGKSLFGGACEVSLAQVVKVDRNSFHGLVFNLQTASGAYLADGIIAHNCRCAMSFADGEIVEAEES